MQYGFCFLAVIPMRAEASDASEMVSQILFGEVFEILEMTEKWFHIKLAFDNYEGWIDSKQCLFISEEEFRGIQTWSYTITEREGEIKIDNNIFSITFGAILPQCDKFILNGKEFNILSDKKSFSDFSLLEILEFYKGSPYLWGGKSTFGIDCSGFVQNVFKILGYSLPRDASLQQVYGEMKSIHDAKPYDVLFFSNEKGKIIHVGMALEDQKIIHASGYVRIDKWDQRGIFNEKSDNYTHYLHSIKRIF